MIKSHKKWDIFCKVVDNFGDIGVCWRLAKQLHYEHGLQVRLFVDNLSIAAKILTGIGNVAEQYFEGVQVVRWDDSLVFDSTAEVVIETFACGLPANYLAQMHSDTVWVNVDHLSAESWVSEFHGLHGKHSESNFKRHFYFPGFSEHTGGLLRERALIRQRDAFQQSKELQQQFWQPLGVKDDAENLKISLFSYSNAPVDALLKHLAKGALPVSVFMPINNCVPSCLLGYTDLSAGDCLLEGNLTLYLLPFLDQANYDKLLWSCDVNFVRGEDSWVRALWAGNPFVWQPYIQTDNAHLVKLSAYIHALYREHALKQTIAKLHEAWSIEIFPSEVWQFYLDNLPEIKTYTQQLSKEVSEQNSLAEKLIDFCANLAN